MKKNVVKTLAIVLLIALLGLAVCTTVGATGNGIVSYDGYDANKIKQNASDSTGTAANVERILQAILTITQVVGVGVAVIMLIVLAIKYISAAPGDKADIKKHAVVYIVGAVVLFAATGILQIIKNFALMVQPNGK